MPRRSSPSASAWRAAASGRRRSSASARPSAPGPEPARREQPRRRLRGGGDFDKAVEYYKKAIAIAPESREVKNNYTRFVELYQGFKSRQSKPGDAKRRGTARGLRAARSPRLPAGCARPNGPGAGRHPPAASPGSGRCGRLPGPAAAPHAPGQPVQPGQPRRRRRRHKTALRQGFAEARGTRTEEPMSRQRTPSIVLAAALLTALPLWAGSVDVKLKLPQSARART